MEKMKKAFIELEQGKVFLLTTSQAAGFQEENTFWGDRKNTILQHTIHFTKAEILPGFVSGTLLVPKENTFRQDKISLGYRLSQKELIFVDEPSHIFFLKSLLSSLSQLNASTPGQFFYQFLDSLIQDDMEHLQQIEATCYHMEATMSEEKWQNDPTPVILHYRKLLLERSFYYQQLAGLAQVLASNANGIFSEKEILCFSNLENRVERLYEHTQMLREYIIQIRELYQQQLDLHQNDTMRLLTVITAFFLPLTLIAGWYGMNFVNMPELKSPQGYFVIIGICILVVIGEFTYFKHKKFF